MGSRQRQSRQSFPCRSSLTPCKQNRPRPKPCRSRSGGCGTCVGRDYRTGALTVAVLALAVLLGWMVGRVGWSMAVNRAPAQAAITPDETQAMAPVIPETPPATSRREEPPVPAKTVAARADSARQAGSEAEDGNSRAGRRAGGVRTWQSSFSDAALGDRTSGYGRR